MSNSRFIACLSTFIYFRASGESVPAEWFLSRLDFFAETYAEVVILNELEVCEDNLPLLLHASGPPMRAALKLIEGKNLPLSPVIQKYLTLN